ncbi:MAG: hypothetical protein K0R54_5272 [Clostridiaceae bacterium]|nr:hypothetical protein [Clostridiaceae bacterium]
MNLEYGIVNESVKYKWGNFSTSPKIVNNKDSDLFADKTIALTTCKRGSAAFQVFIRADEEIMATVTSKPQFSHKGNLSNVRIHASVEGIDDSNIKMFFVGLAEDDDKIHKADILLNDDSIYIDKNRCQPIWVDIMIPHDFKAGTYAGKVGLYEQYMFNDEIEVNSLEFTITVKDVLLPEPQNYSFYLDLWQHLSNISRKHEVKLWSDEHFSVIENYVKSLAELGQKAITVIASEIPWSGQGCFRVKNYPSDLFEYNIIKIEKSANGNFIYDFSNLERYIDLCTKYGIDKEIEILGLICIWKYEDEGFGRVTVDYPDAIRLRYLDRKDNCYKYIKCKEEVKGYLQALEKFFVNKGVIDIVRIAADEPADKMLYNEVLNFIKESCPAFRYKTYINHIDFIEESMNKIDDFVPYLPAISAEWENIKSIKKEIKGKLLWYVCCEPLYPNTFISSPLIESRFIGWLTAFLNLDGFIRWNYTVWPGNPREKISYNYPTWFAGDTNFVYPANNGKPLLTLRYKNLKRGIEEYELISILREKHNEPDAVLQNIWSKIIKNRDIKKFYAQGAVPEDLYSLTYTDYECARNMLLDELEKT